MKGAGVLDPGSLLSYKNTTTGSGSTALFTELPRRSLLGNSGHEKSRGLVYPGSILQIILLTSSSGSATNYLR